MPTRLLPWHNGDVIIAPWATSSTRRHCYDYVINADQCRMSVAAGLRTFTYSTPLRIYKAQTKRAAQYIFMGWSAQRNKHGAFKLKPSEARFQLVINICMKL